MLIKPVVAYEESWVEKIKDFELQFNDTSIDLLLDEIMQVSHNAFFSINKNGSIMRSGVTIYPSKHRTTGNEYWRLKERSCYIGVSRISLDLPDNISVMITGLVDLSIMGVNVPTTILEGEEVYKEFVRVPIMNLFGETNIEVGTPIARLTFHRALDPTAEFKMRLERLP